MCCRHGFAAWKLLLVYRPLFAVCPIIFIHGFLRCVPVFLILPPSLLLVARSSNRVFVSLRFVLLSSAVCCSSFSPRLGFLAHFLSRYAGCVSLVPIARTAIGHSSSRFDSTRFWRTDGADQSVRTGAGRTAPITVGRARQRPPAQQVMTSLHVISKHIHIATQPSICSYGDPRAASGVTGLSRRQLAPSGRSVSLLLRLADQCSVQPQSPAPTGRPVSVLRSADRRTRSSRSPRAPG